jgi:hypothetical protein
VRVGDVVSGLNLPPRGRRRETTLDNGGLANAIVSTRQYGVAVRRYRLGVYVNDHRSGVRGYW